MKNKCLEYLTIHALSGKKIVTITKRNERKMKKIKFEQVKVLKEILGKKWKKIPVI